MSVDARKEVTPPCQKIDQAMGVLTLAIINVAAVLSVRNYPMMAEFGWASVGWYIVGTILFLIPISLAGAELASCWPEGGGLYAWVKQAFGERVGFVALFCQWSNNLVWYPLVLAFIVSTFAFEFTPSLKDNPYYIMTLMLLTLWGTTAIGFFGTRVATRVSNTGVIFGSIFPTAIIIIFGTWWMITTSASALPEFTVLSLLPIPCPATIPYFSTVILLFTGMEMAGFHALSTKNPQKDYPRAIAISAVIILLCTILGTLAIASVVPHSQLIFDTGVMQALQFFFTASTVSWIVTPIAALITLGGVSLLVAWLIGPAQGLYIAAKEGALPPFFHRKNRYGAPVAILLIQATVGSCIVPVYLMLFGVTPVARNLAFTLLTAVTCEVLCIVYFLLFAALIKLRYSQPNVSRPFKIPGGKLGAWLVAGTGMFGLIFAFIVGVWPTTSLITPPAYCALVLGITLILVLPTFVLLRFKKPGWVVTGYTPTNTTTPTQSTTLSDE